MLQLAPCRCHPALLSCTRGRTSWVCFIASPTQLLISLLGSQLELNFSLIICAGIEAIDLRVQTSPSVPTASISDVTIAMPKTAAVVGALMLLGRMLLLTF